MSKQTINVGNTPNDRKGDSLRSAFLKVNANFTELYTALGLDEAPLNLGAFEFTGSTISTTDSSAVVIDQATTISSDLTVGGDILPSTALGGDLGSSTKPWKSLYVSNNTIFIGGTPIAIDGSGNLTVDGSTVSGFDQNLNTTDAVEFLSMDINSNSLFDGAGDTGLNIRSSDAKDNVYIYSYGSDGDGTGAGNIYVKSDGVEIYSDWQNGGAGEKKWTFSGDGSLTIPGSIKSEGDITFEINLSDSTLRSWRFGEDGSLTLAGPITNLRTDEGKIALGFESGLTNQGGGTVAVGQYAGRLNQSGSGVAVGGLAGNTDQGVSAVAVGALAGGTNQGVAAVAVGALAGGEDQGQGTVAIGQLAGGLRQGEYAIAIGTSAGVTDQPANSIVLNASGAQLNGSAAGFYVDPIRNIEGGAFLNYNTSTKELGWSNDISSENDINIDINLSDSTLRRWTFGEDGNLNLAGHLQFPNGAEIRQSTLGELRLRGAAGQAAQLQGLDTNGSVDSAVKALYNDSVGSFVTIHTNIDAGAPEYIWSFDYNGDLTFPDDTVQNTAFTTSPTLNVLKIDDGVHEKFQALADATGTVTHDCSSGHIFYHTSPDANWTVNLTNLDLSTTYATSVTIIVIQGDPAYYPSALEIGGSAQTINWQGGSTPTPTADGIDVVTFSILNNNGTYTVLGQLTSFDSVA